MRKPKVPKIGTIEYNCMVANMEAEEKRLEKQKADEAAQKKAERDAEHRFQIKLVFITVAATLFVDHFGEILQLLEELIHLVTTFID